MSVRKNFGVTNNNAVDRHVGRRLRARRIEAGLNQEGLAELLGVSFQQVQKYEKGSNRISASRLWDLSRILAVPVGYFFDDMDSETAAASPANAAGLPMFLGAPAADPLDGRETASLMRAYYKIPNKRVRRGFTEMLRAVGALIEERPPS